MAGLLDPREHLPAPVNPWPGVGYRAGGLLLGLLGSDPEKFMRRQAELGAILSGDWSGQAFPQEFPPAGTLQAEPSDDWLGLLGTGAIPGAGPAAILGHTFGVKRWPPMFHGVKGGPAVAEDILKEGFTKGQSAGYKIPGTSISEDPLVSLRVFANNTPEAMLEVRPTIDPSQVRNLRPSEYLAGGVPEARVYRKPSFRYQEAETFGKREQGPLPWLADLKEKALAEVREQGDVYNAWNRAEGIYQGRSATMPEEISRARARWLKGVETAETVDYLLSPPTYYRLDPSQRLDVQMRAIQEGKRFGILSEAQADDLIRKVDAGETALIDVTPPPFEPRPLSETSRRWVEQGQRAWERHLDARNALRVVHDRGLFTEYRPQAGGLLTARSPKSEDYFKEVTRTALQAHLETLEGLKGFRGTYVETVNSFLNEMLGGIESPNHTLPYLLRRYAERSPQRAEKLGELKDEVVRWGKARSAAGKASGALSALDNRDTRAAYDGAIKETQRAAERVMNLYRELLATPARRADG